MYGTADIVGDVDVVFKQGGVNFATSVCRSPASSSIVPCIAKSGVRCIKWNICQRRRHRIVCCASLNIVWKFCLSAE